MNCSVSANSTYCYSLDGGIPNSMPMLHHYRFFHQYANPNGMEEDYRLRFSEIENACEWQSRQTMRTRLCGGISADLTFLLLFWSSKKVEKNQFFSPDNFVQLPEFTQSYNRYSYCLNNPLKYVDPTGMAYFERNGRIIGNDGVDDGKTYVLKNAVLTGKEMRSTVKFIKANSGNTEAFMNNQIVYKNSIEIVSSLETRQIMYNHVSADNGLEGTRPENNQEHGGYLDNGVATQVLSGPVVDQSVQNTAYIMLPQGYDKYHSHPSGTRGGIDINANPNSFGVTPVSSFVQLPDQSHFENIGNNTGYVFGKGDGIF